MVEIILSTADNLSYRVQKDVFLVLGMEEREVSENGYCKYDDDYDIWFPIISSEKNGWSNCISCDCSVIEENPDAKGTRKDIQKRKKRMVFAKFQNGFKFIGVFVPDEHENENRRKIFFYKKIANSIIINGGKNE